MPGFSLPAASFSYTARKKSLILRLTSAIIDDKAVTLQSYLGLVVFFVKSSPRDFAVKIKDQVHKQTNKERTENEAKKR